jgi:hypothetical protein
MDAHWARWHHGTVTDPKWRVVARAASNAMKRQVTVATVTAVWAHMFECASQAERRGELEGWSNEAVAACIDIDEEEVAAIYVAMQGRTIEGNRLIAWGKRQPKRERPEDSSTERVRNHRNAKKNSETPCNATERQETPRGEERRVEEKHSNTPRSVEPPSHTQRESAREDDPFEGHDRDQVPDSGREFELLDDHDQNTVRPYVPHLLPELRIPLALLAELVRHLRTIGKPMSMSMWKLFIGDCVLHHANGGNCAAAIRLTIQAGNCARLITTEKPQARAGPQRQNGVTTDFENVDYRQG